MGTEYALVVLVLPIFANNVVNMGVAHRHLRSLQLANFTQIHHGFLFSFDQLIPIMSASIAPLLPSIASDLAISASTAQITMSIYFVGMGIAPFLIEVRILSARDQNYQLSFHRF